MATQLEYWRQPPEKHPPANPWRFVPSLYFLQSVPNIIVTLTFVSVYKDLGIDNLRITFWTSIISLPWTFKMFWGPFVDLNFTKRQWTIATQILIFGALVLAAVVVRLPGFFPLSLAALFMAAMFSATQDIACDGLYLLSLDRPRQAAFVGVMAVSARLGWMFSLFGVLYLAGRLQRIGWRHDNAWAAALLLVAAVYGLGVIWNIFFLPRPAIDAPVSGAQPVSGAHAAENLRNVYRTLAVIAAGACAYFLLSSAMQLSGHAIHLSASGPRARQVTADWRLDAHEIRTQMIIAMAAVAALILLVPFCRRLIAGSTMGDAFSTYFRQPSFGAILLFIIFYRFGEAMIFKIVPLFLQGSRSEGGMGLDVDTVGVVWGALAPLGVMLGGLAGGAVISRLGLRRSFWPLVLAMHTPNLLYVWVSLVRPATIWLYPVALIEACGFGFGFAGYFVYLMYVAQRGNYRTSHYAIGTGLVGLFTTVAGIGSGILQQSLGYVGFFIASCVLTIPGTLTLLIIPMDNAPGDDGSEVTNGEITSNSAEKHR